MRATSERVGLLVIRAWVEAGDSELRARITGRLDVVNSKETSFTVVVGVDSAADVVRDWLEELERGVSAGSVTKA
jgi:uncharacterized membrane protein